VDGANLVWDAANANLVVGGAPTGAATTDRLQVNGTALFGPLRVSFTAGGVQSILTQTVAAGLLQLLTASVTSGNSGLVKFGSGGTSDAAGATGNVQAQTGNATTAGGFSGSVIFSTGNFKGAGASGNINFSTGAVSLVATGARTGSISFTCANVGTTAGTVGGSITFKPGQGPAGSRGQLIFKDSGNNIVAGTDATTNGYFAFGNYTAGVVVPTGSIQIIDLGGTVRTIPCL
jgi:hypothetical protein